MIDSPSRANRLIWLALIVAVAILFRFWRIASLPPGFHFDESFEALEAWRIFTNPAYRPIFLEGNFGVAPLNAYAVAIGFWIGSLFGVDAGPALMRSVSAIAGVLTVLAVYGLATEFRQHERGRVLSGWFPLWAAAALAVMRWHIHFSRMGIEPIWGALEWSLALWALLRGWRTGSWLAYGAAGIVTALSLYTYQGVWVLPFVVAFSALLLLIFDRSGSADVGASRRWLGLLLAGGVAAATAAPLLFYFASNLDLIILRPAQVNVVGETASPADAGLLANTWATIAMYWPFGATGDMDPRRNLPGAPALNLWLAIPFVLGVGLAIWRIRRIVYGTLLAGLVGLLSVGVFTEYAPHFHRILAAAAPTALLCAIGLDAIWTWQPARAAFLRWSAVALIVLAGVFGWRDYFVRWAALPDLFYAFDEGLWQIGNWIADQPDDEPIYLSPRDAEHPTLAFAWQTRGRPAPVTYDGRSIFPAVDGMTQHDERYVAITHEDFRTPLLLPDVLPDAVADSEFTDWDGASYATIWTRPAGTASARPPFVAHAAAFGDGIRLQGYDAQPSTLHPGDILYVQLHWLVDAVPAHNWTVYIHLIDPMDAAAPPVAGHDGLPGGGSLPTLRWQPGWRVLDEHQIPLPAELTPGRYEIRLGMYDGEGNQLGPVMLGEVVIE